MDFYKIGALKVFSDLGALIEEDERNKVKFMDIPTDIIHNNIASYLLKDKVINKVFHERDDYYLLNMLCGKIWNVQYIEPNTCNEYKTDINLNCIITYVNTEHKLNCDSYKIEYRVNNLLNLHGGIIKLYDNDKYLGSVSLNSYSLRKINDKNNDILIRNKECQTTMNKLREDIKQYTINYKKNY